MFDIFRPFSTHAPLELEYLLVTQDSSFVALDQLLPRLKLASTDASLRSKFRYFYPIASSGLDAEADYVSTTYPPVPADSGALMSRDLVHYLAAMAGSNMLKSFSASVSISLGVWLAPAGPSYADDAMWALGNHSCSEASIAAGPFTAQGILQAWNNYLECGKICECS